VGCSCTRGYNGKALLSQAAAWNRADDDPLGGKVCEQTGRAAEAQELAARAERIRALAQSTPAKP